MTSNQSEASIKSFKSTLKCALSESLKAQFPMPHTSFGRSMGSPMPPLGGQEWARDPIGMVSWLTNPLEAGDKYGQLPCPLYIYIGIALRKTRMGLEHSMNIIIKILIGDYNDIHH